VIRTSQDKTPSVLHVASTIGAADGISTATMNMVVAFQRAGLTARLLVAEYPGAPLHANVAGLADTTVLPTRGLGSLRYPIGFAHELRRLAQGVDLVHLHGLWRYPTIVGGPILRASRVPYVISPHGLLMQEALAHHAVRKMIALRLAERHTLGSAQLLVADGAKEQEALRSKLPSLRTSVVQLAVDTGVFRRELDQRSHGSEHHTLLSVSRISPIKRLVELADAFGRAARNRPDWDLVVAGPEDDPDYRRQVEAMARQRGVTERVRFVGRLDGTALVNAYRDADVFVLPSTSESSGLSVIEAMAVGLPVIATTGAPWAEIASERVGWWIPPGVEALTAAIEDAMNTAPAERQAISDRARALALRNYSLDALRERLVATYRDAVRSGLGGTRPIKP
jgi:glycosyltransferase involved in cell wall biosynthesis